MRNGRLVAAFVATGFENDYGFAVGCSTQRTHELACIGDAFQVHHDAVGMRVAGQKIKGLRQAYRAVRPQ